MDELRSFKMRDIFPISQHCGDSRYWQEITSMTLIFCIGKNGVMIR